MEHKTKVDCPKCGEETFKLVGYEDYGDYWNPPSFDFDIETSCKCEFTDEEWDEMYENFMSLYDIITTIGNLEHGMVELECRMSDVSAEYTDEEAKKLTDMHDKESIRINEVEQKQKELMTKIYGDDY